MKTTFNNAHNCAGRSVVEILLAITIAGILTAGTVPAYSFLVTDARTRTLAGEFHSMLFAARSEAVKRGQTVQVVSLSGTADWASGARSFVDADGDGIQDAGETVLWESEAFGGAYTLNGAGASLRYLPTGVLSVAPAVVSFNLCKDGVSGELGRTISISQTGRASVAETTCG